MKHGCAECGHTAAQHDGQWGRCGGETDRSVCLCFQYERDTDE